MRREQPRHWDPAQAERHPRHSPSESPEPLRARHPRALLQQNLRPNSRSLRSHESTDSQPPRQPLHFDAGESLLRDELLGRGVFRRQPFPFVGDSGDGQGSDLSQEPFPRQLQPHRIHSRFLQLRDAPEPRFSKPITEQSTRRFAFELREFVVAAALPQRTEAQRIDLGAAEHDVSRRG